MVYSTGGSVSFCASARSARAAKKAAATAPSTLTTGLKRCYSWICFFFSHIFCLCFASRRGVNMPLILKSVSRIALSEAPYVLAQSFACFAATAVVRAVLEAVGRRLSAMRSTTLVSLWSGAERRKSAKAWSADICESAQVSDEMLRAHASLSVLAAARSMPLASGVVSRCSEATGST